MKPQYKITIFQHPTDPLILDKWCIEHWGISYWHNRVNILHNVLYILL